MPGPWEQRAIIPPRGGRVFTRAVMNAANRVPGRVGRKWEVFLPTDRESVLVERIGSGPYPLVVFSDGGVLFPAPRYAYSMAQGSGRIPSRAVPNREELAAGFPFNRWAKIVAIMAAPGTVLKWDGTRYQARIVPPGAVWDGCLYTSGEAFNFRHGSERNGRGGGFDWNIPVNAEWSRTFCGSRASTRASRGDFWNFESRMSDWTSSWSPGAWDRVLHPRADSEAPPDALARLPARARLYNSQEDPGGEGDPCGSEDSEPDYDSDPDDFDEDGEPVYTATGGGPSVTAPRPPASSFREWEAIAFPPPTPVRSRVRMDGRVPLPDRVNITGCRHCNGMNPECEQCRAAGQCAVCLGAYPAPSYEDTARMVLESQRMMIPILASDEFAGYSVSTSNHIASNTVQVRVTRTEEPGRGLNMMHSFGMSELVGPAATITVLLLQVVRRMVARLNEHIATQRTARLPEFTLDEWSEDTP